MLDIKTHLLRSICVPLLGALAAVATIDAPQAQQQNRPLTLEGKRAL